MKILIENLKEFSYAQLDKFVKRMYKHPDASVTNDLQFYNSIEDSKKYIEDHLVEEFCEYFLLDKEIYNILIDEISHNKSRGFKEELVDIANIAFLIWCIKD